MNVCNSCQDIKTSNVDLLMEELEENSGNHHRFQILWQSIQYLYPTLQPMKPCRCSMAYKTTRTHVELPSNCIYSTVQTMVERAGAGQRSARSAWTHMN